MTSIAREFDVVICADLFELDAAKKIYNTYVAVSPQGLIAKFRKLHPFISPHLSAGHEYVVFVLHDWKCGILICYDNNVIKNVRATALLGAEMILMRHVTMCTPSSRPGAGFVQPDLWKPRLNDLTSLRVELDGLKGRAWLMEWLPARAYDNGVYVIFSNPIGMDHDQLKNGCSMILDLFGTSLTSVEVLGRRCVQLSVRKRKLAWQAEVGTGRPGEQSCTVAFFRDRVKPISRSLGVL